MIFVTVGTHEQPFDRLVEALDQLKKDNRIAHEVFIQTGYSGYKPRYCEFSPFIGFEEMLKRIREADIVITHGGTGSIMLALYDDKIPVVMPRQKQYREHIDDHQLIFCRTMEAKGKLIPAYEAPDLEGIIHGYPALVETLREKNAGGGAVDIASQAAEVSRKLLDICSQWEEN